MYYLVQVLPVDILMGVTYLMNGLWNKINTESCMLALVCLITSFSILIQNKKIILIFNSCANLCLLCKSASL